MKNESMREFLLSTEIALKNGLTADLQSELSVYGYGQAKMEEGQALYDEAYELFIKQKNEYAEQYGATEDFESKFEQASKVYMKHLKIARVVLKVGKEEAVKLNLNGRRKKSLTGFIGQAELFYQNVFKDETILERLAQFGLSSDLGNGRDLMQKAKDANAVQETEKGQAQAATIKRDKALDELDDWIGDFIAMAKIAFEDTPQNIILRE